ncbi:hypothetical protein TRAPUB_11444 [Trametes pubescens]|uniref:Uncharacterized protein n=1 Tax=Trametes pubescens TaxID=154538 RepID=A0A1M2VWU6_TRAPU|nr:hypothetical protein TRAPUB_11444 [Trametes pubescens]
MGYADPQQPGTDTPDQGHALEDLRLYRLFLSATVAPNRVTVDPGQRLKQPRPPRHLARVADEEFADLGDGNFSRIYITHDIIA